MTYTGHQTTLRVLRREIAGTVGLLTDEHDFRAMRRYHSFVFDDHRTYLRHVETLLRARALQGTHTTLALFDPEEYAEFCAQHGINPDTHASRTRFTAELAATGATISYEGQPLTDLLPTLVDKGVRQATREYAAALLARLGVCPSCGEDLGRAAFSRASQLIVRILATAGPGSRHLVCSVAGSPGTLLASLHAEEADGRLGPEDAEILEFTTVLAVALATGDPGGLVMRTTTPDAPDRVHGWRLRAYGVEPLTAGEVFDAYCTDIESGGPIAPESNVDYCAPPDLGEGPDPHHH